MMGCSNTLRVRAVVRFCRTESIMAFLLDAHVACPHIDPVLSETSESVSPRKSNMKKV